MPLLRDDVETLEQIPKGARVESEFSRGGPL